jgi:hypothetical protein
MKVRGFIERSVERALKFFLVSMVDGHLFEKIASIAARLRKKTDRPFGGIQVSPVFGMHLSMLITFLYSSSSLATSSSSLLSPKEASKLSSRSNAMHGKHASNTPSH